MHEKPLLYHFRRVVILTGFVLILTGVVFYKMFEAQITEALSTVSLNNGTATLDDDTALTSQSDLSGGEIGAYTWTEDGTNVAALNMPFNAGGAQNDYSGNGNNGSVSGALVTTVGCQVGTCMTFDGIDDHVTLSDTPVWNFSDALTVSLWLSSSQANVNGQAAISQGSASNDYSFLYWLSGSTSDDNISLYIQTNVSGISAVSCNFAEGTFFNGTWHHVVGVYDRTENELRMYVDGAPACETTVVPNEPLRDLGGGVHLGRLPFSTSYFNGKLDEVQVYGSVLSDNQISQLRTDGNLQRGGPTIIQPDQTTVGEVWDLTITPIQTNGTVGSPIDSVNTVTIEAGGGGGLSVTLNNGNTTAGDHDPVSSQVTGLSSNTGAFEWSVSGNPYMSLNIPFNSGGTQADFSGNGSSGTVVGPVVPPIPSTSCKVGTCLDFDGIDDHVSIAGTFGGASEVTVAAWAKVEVADTGNFQAVISSTDQSFVHLQVNYPGGGGNLAVYTNSTTILLPMVTLSAGTWHHIVIAARSGSTKVYVNGTEVSSSVATFSTINSTTSLNIGRGFGGGRRFNGMIDEVQIYPRALTEAQIDQLYSDGNGGLGGPIVVVDDETSVGDVWDLTVTPVLTDGTVGTPVGSTNTVEIFADGVPSAISNLSAIAGDEQVTLTWSPPANNGSAITDYIVEYGETSGFPGNVQVFNDGVSASMGATVTGLTNDTNYSFRVAAVNGVGQGSYSNVDNATPSLGAAPQNETEAELTIDINDFLSFSIENLAGGDEPAGDQPFGAGVQITGLTSSGVNDYAISGEFGSPLFTQLQTMTNSNDGYNVMAYVSNVGGRTNALLRLGGSGGNAADEIEDTLTRLSVSQAANDTLDTASDTGLAFRLHDANTSALVREADEDTQWGDNDTSNALWAAFPLGSGAAQIIYDTLQFSEAATTAYINWFVGIDPQQRSGSYSGQVTFTASVN